MKAKNLIQLLSLSTSLYMLSKDEELMNKVSDLAKKGTQKLNDFYDHVKEGDDDEQLSEKVLRTLKEAKEELDRKIEEAVIRIYEKMNIAHTNSIAALQEELNNLKKELALAEARIIHLESQK